MWFILLLLIATAAAFPTSTYPRSTTTQLIYYDSALGYPCYTNSNCGGLVGNSRCLDGICACQPGYVPQGIMRCIYSGGGKNNK